MTGRDEMERVARAIAGARALPGTPGAFYRNITANRANLKIVKGGKNG